VGRTFWTDGKHPRGNIKGLPPISPRALLRRYGVFGYAVEGQDILRDCKVSATSSLSRHLAWVCHLACSKLSVFRCALKVGDIIESVKITRGAENLVNGYSTAKAAPAVEAAENAAETPAPASE
jgi:hypothetical protein